MDEPTLLEFERLCNQASSLAQEQQDLSTRCRRQRMFIERIGLVAGFLALLILLAAGVGGPVLPLVATAALLMLISLGCTIANGLGGPGREIEHHVKATELAVLHDACSFVVAEHEAGRLAQEEFREWLDHHTGHFSRLSRSLEHPFR